MSGLHNSSGDCSRITWQGRRPLAMKIPRYDWLLRKRMEYRNMVVVVFKTMLCCNNWTVPNVSIAAWGRDFVARDKAVWLLDISHRSCRQHITIFSCQYPVIWCENKNKLRVVTCLSAASFVTSWLLWAWYNLHSYPYLTSILKTFWCMHERRLDVLIAHLCCRSLLIQTFLRYN